MRNREGRIPSHENMIRYWHAWRDRNPDGSPEAVIAQIRDPELRYAMRRARIEALGPRDWVTGP